MSAAGLGARLQAAYGFSARPSWSRELSRAVEEVCRRHGLDAGTLHGRLDAEPHLLDELAGLVTVGETYFYRHPSDIQHAVSIITALLAGRSAEEPCVVWSAGCASGEEPYTLAMELDRRLGAAAPARVRILATDVNSDALAKARAGIYSAWSFRGVGTELRERYFLPLQPNAWQVAPRLLERIAWHRSGLAQHAATMASGSVDVIFFRNVAIYLEADALAQLYRQFRRVMRPGGTLYVASADPFPPRELFTRVAAPGVAAFRPADDDARLPVAPPPSGPVPGAPPQRHDVKVPPPAPVTRVAATPAPDAPPPGGGVALALAEARRLADRGELAEALALVSRAALTDPLSADVALLCGQLHVATGELTEATSALRRAVYLAPGGMLHRYWYASALAAAGDRARARQMLLDVERQLAARGAAERVEDQQTTVEELADSARFLRESLS
ncbi:MAG: tetratricopeptide repeat protein [Deltaproteobacteria bacterium]|nr:tetratricopeptide repeat protein [Deltaproteobacteria bacterium]